MGIEQPTFEILPPASSGASKTACHDSFNIFKEQLMFPEMHYNKIDQTQRMDFCSRHHPQCVLESCLRYFLLEHASSGRCVSIEVTKYSIGVALLSLEKQDPLYICYF